MVDLTPFNTLRVPAKAENLIEITSLPQLFSHVAAGIFTRPYFILGHGANILFTKNFPGTIVKINFSGIEIVSESADSLLVKAMAGQDWHEFVMWSVSHNFSGIENLALIPGTVGAAAAGNIAAYGQNQENVLDRLEVVDLLTGEEKTLHNHECKFGYRDSLFKSNEYKNYLITSATYHLSKTAHLETSYHASRHTSLISALQALGSPPYSVAQVAQAVINLRTQKLPDWHTAGTAGSFFKNPLVLRPRAEQIKKSIPDLQFYPPEKLTYQDPSITSDLVKLPAGMLLEEAGWRGKRIGQVGASPQHALIILNYGGATGGEIFTFSESMRSDIKSKFDIDLEYEVVIV